MAVKTLDTVSDSTKSQIQRTKSKMFSLRTFKLNSHEGRKTVLTLTSGKRTFGVLRANDQAEVARLSRAGRVDVKLADNKLVAEFVY